MDEGDCVTSHANANECMDEHRNLLYDDNYLQIPSLFNTNFFLCDKQHLPVWQLTNSTWRQQAYTWGICKMEV